ncbi:hypothetical protein FSW04_19410 [Baekduia soli]|uniref:Bacterial repeat domain-containing protein n=1 Tax=Baekduia soli TaxID=496014 RepID=A0A5B8UA27_9ACTN|nr:NHL repeat-containing protein [Baekduia soli]QEC49522.1 hypothetical protein FSW04_19410 [Baekduia soli]
MRSVGALAGTPGGGVVAADTANNRVQAFDAGGTITAAWGIAGRGPGYVTRPRGVAFGPDGGVAVADSFDQRIALYAPDGTFAGQRGQVSATTGFATQGSAAGQFSLPAGVAYDAAGDLWVADTGNDRVVELGPDGAVLLTAGAGIGTPAAIAAAPGGGALVTDTDGGRLLRVVPDGTTSVVRAGLSHPAAVAVAADGTTYVADDTSVSDAATGTAITGPGGSATWDHPAGLAVSPADGTLVVAERRPGTAAGARVVRGTPAGGGARAWDTLLTEGTGDAQVIEPAGLAFSADGGALLVADTGNDRVLRLDAPGHPVPAPPTLQVGIDRPALGTVVSDLPGIACVTDCRQRYGAGRVVTLTARPAAGAVLASWSGACAPAGAAPTCALTMGAGDAAVGAAFAPAPPPPATAPPAPAPPPPVVLRSVRLSTHRLHGTRPAARRRADRRATRATATVTLTRPATLTVAVQVGRPGRRQGSSCRAPSRANRRGASCTRFVALPATRTLRATTTTVRFTLTTVFAGRRLHPGSHRLAVTARDAQGNRVGPRTVAFRVTR